MFLLELSEALRKAKVPFCLVGGYAVTQIPVASLEGLIAMKQDSPRAQDREDVRSLKAILKAKKS